jgi:N-acetylglutamate synthase-like GNAT family acetyltransferase
MYTVRYRDWRKRQQYTVERIGGERAIQVWVAQVDGSVARFIAHVMNLAENTGQVDLIAAHPDYENHGIGTELNIFAISSRWRR